MKKYLFGFLLFSFLFAQDDSWMLYDDSEVAIINISTSAEAVDYMYADPWSDSLHFASVHFQNALINETVDSVAVRIRGNTSRDSQKKSFKIDFEHYIPGREFYGVDKLNINGEHNDPSIIRAKLAWDFFNEIGVVSARAAHVALYINEVYYGLYVSIEHYDREFLKKNFDDPDGNLWKCLWSSDLNIRGNGLPEDYDPLISGQRGYNLQTNEDVNDFSKLANLIDVINNTSDFQFPIELEQIMNVNSFFKVMAMDVILGSWDDYWSLTNNYYLYHEPTQDKFHFIPYDYDNIMSIDWFGRDWATEDIYDWYRIETGRSRPLIDRMLTNDHYSNLFTHLVEFYSDHVFELNLWESKLDSLYNMIRPYAEPDTFRVLDYSFTLEHFDNSYSENYDTLHVKNGIRQYVNARNASIPEQLSYRDASPVIYKMDYTPENPIAGDSITFNVSVFDEDGIAAVEFQYLINELNPTIDMFTYNPVPGTKLVDEYDNWSFSIKAPGEGSKIEFIIRAVDEDGAFEYYPASQDLMTILIPGSGNDAVIINEFLAQNTAVIQDENGDFADWVELYNTSDEAIDLAGYHLSDRSDRLDKWQFPDSGSVIEPGDFMLVWCDEEQSQGVLHTNFKLSSTGEFVSLTAPDGVTVLDSLTFAAQTANISFGREADASETWDFLGPTPGASNTITAIEDDPLNPQEFKLSAYPNPFNSTVKISYYLMQSSDVSVKIFNTLGKKVWQLKHKKQSSGTHSFNWDGRSNQMQDVSSGLYVVVVDSESLTESVKIILLK